MCKEKGSFISKVWNILFAGKPLTIHSYSKISHKYKMVINRKMEKDHSPTYICSDQLEIKKTTHCINCVYLYKIMKTRVKLQSWKEIVFS